MFESVSRAKPFFYLLNTAILLSFLVTGVAAQGFGDRSRAGGTGGNNVIQGRIQSPSNRPVAAARIRLESTNSGILTTTSDVDGVFRFNSLEPGNYTITIEVNEEYEIARESVYIDKERRGNVASQTFNVVVSLRLKGNLKVKPGVINASLAAVPKPALKAFEKALEASSKGDTALAIQKFNEAIALHSQFTEAHAELGFLYLKTGQLDKSIASFRKALELNEKNLNIRLNYGIALLNKKQMTEAEKELREVIKGDEKSATAHMYLGIALLGLRRIDEAESEFLRAISIKDDEKLAQAHRYLGGIYWGKENYQQAADALEKYLKLAPKAADAAKIRETIKQLREKTK